MLAGGIFRQENALRNANRSRENRDFLSGYRLALRASFTLGRLLAPVEYRVVYGGAAMVFDPRAKNP